MKLHGLILSALIFAFLLMPEASVQAAPAAEKAAQEQKAIPAENSHLVSKEGEMKLVETKAQKPVSKKVNVAEEAEAEEPELEGDLMELSGIVSAVGPSGVAVEYQFDSKTGSVHEAWLPFHKNVKFEGYKSYKDIQYMDRVKVAFIEAKNKSTRMLKEVKFVHRPAVKEEPAAAEPAPVPEEPQAPEAPEGAAKADENA